MADGKQFEYGQSASEVQFQDEVGKVKNRQGEACIEVTDDQNVGIGTDSPGRKLDVLDASDPQLRLSRVASSNYVDLTTTAGDNLLADNGGATSFMQLTRGATNAYSVYQNATTGGGTLGNNNDGKGTGLSIGCTNNIAYIWMKGTGSSGTMNIGAGGSGGLTLDADNNIVALEGSFQLKAEIAAPSAPGSGDGGIIYVKDDGIPYYISNSTAETSLVGGGGGGTTTTGTTLVTADPAPAVAGTMYLCNAASAFNVTLPTAAAAGNGGTVDVCKAAGANDITVLRAGSDTINGATSQVVSVLYANVTLISDGTDKWYIK